MVSVQLLLENDNWFAPEPKQILQSMEQNYGNILLESCLQREGAKNAMGRIYPYEILKREFDVYEAYVNERSAHMEADHPQCFRETAKILTKNNGWQFIKDIAEDEVVFTLNPKTREIEEQKITKKIVQPYKGKMISFDGMNFKTVVTPGHRFIYEDRGELKFITAQELLDNNKRGISIPKSGNWQGTDYDKWIFEGVNLTLYSHKSAEYMELMKTPLEIDAHLWFAIFGLWLAEGSSSNSGLSICQIHPEKVEQIRALFQRLPSHIEWFETKGKTPNKFGHYGYNWDIKDHRIGMYLKQFGKCYTKFIPNEIKGASKSLLEQLFYWFNLGDGRMHADGKMRDIFSTSRKLVEDLQEVMLKIGSGGNLKTYIATTDYQFAGRTIKAENKKPIHFFNISHTNSYSIDQRMIKITEIEYDGNVCCVEVPNGTFYAGEDFDHLTKCFWSGNSVVITLANSCSIVSKQWWVKNERIGRKEWWGNIEVYPAFKGADVQKLVQSRIKFGVSSRGVGSTEKSMQQEADVVQNDFTIITFDIVSHPSTHFAIPRLKVDRTLTTEGAVGTIGNGIYNRITQNKINMFLANRNKIAN